MYFLKKIGYAFTNCLFIYLLFMPFIKKKKKESEIMEVGK